MEPSHLQLRLVDLGWAALPNAAFPSLSVLHNSIEGWKLREIWDSAHRLNIGRIYNTKYRERKPLSTHAEQF